MKQLSRVVQELVSVLAARLRDLAKFARFGSIARRWRVRLHVDVARSVPLVTLKVVDDSEEKDDALFWREHKAACTQLQQVFIKVVGLNVLRVAR